ncbi:hypothetical protein BD311DRAFT_458788 [Dichomitus squalens]|uniref:Uncharacterized protein n=1 Tax=Dichomitus squalens TaxID=114155 RepID=A0A4Q9MH17_9APHY|nr:hypothetical protein BD311DRAFT_458788 [Dichomitus squalens]
MPSSFRGPRHASELSFSCLFPTLPIVRVHTLAGAPRPCVLPTSSHFFSFRISNSHSPPRVPEPVRKYLRHRKKSRSTRRSGPTAYRLS